MTPVISTENLVDRDDDELSLSQNELLIIGDIEAADLSNESFISQKVTIQNDPLISDSLDLP